MVASPNSSVTPRRALLRGNPGFRNLWSANLVSVFGDGLYNVALPWIVYQHTHSGIATALTFAAGTLPYLLVGMVAGVYVDRWNRRLTLVSSDLLRAGTLVLVALVLSRGFNLGAVIAVAFMLPVFSRFFVPAQRATTPQLVGKDGLLAANALMEGASNIAMIAGPALGGVLVVAIGAVPLLVADALTFIASAAFLSRIRFASMAAPAGARPSVAHELAEGLRVAWRTPVLRAICSQAPFANGCFTAVVVLLPIWIARSAHAGSAAYGLLMSAFFAGSFVGSLLLARWGRGLNRARLVLTGLFATGATIAAFGAGHSVIVGALALAAVGVSAAIYNIGVVTLLQVGAPPTQHGRIFALNETCSYTLRPALSLLVGALADGWTVNGVIVAMGGVMILIGVIMLITGVLHEPSAAPPPQAAPLTA